jgi:hypothetical protein
VLIEAKVESEVELVGGAGTVSEVELTVPVLTPPEESVSPELVVEDETLD